MCKKHMKSVRVKQKMLKNVMYTRIMTLCLYSTCVLGRSIKENISFLAVYDFRYWMKKKGRGEIKWKSLN